VAGIVRDKNIVNAGREVRRQIRGRVLTERQRK